MSKRVGLLIGSIFIVFGLTAIFIAVPVGALAQLQGLKPAKGSAEQEKSPAVKVEVKEKDGKKGAQVEVKVEGAESKDKTGAKKPTHTISRL